MHLKILGAVLGVLFLVIGISFVNSKEQASRPVPQSTPTPWCPHGQHAVLVGSGYDQSGTPIEALMCDKNGAHR